MTDTSATYPTKTEADALLQWAASYNPGPWLRHSQLVGTAARAIADRTQHLDPLFAETAGLLHDIGRRYPGTNLRHCLDGYQIMTERGYPLIARICISHCFQLRSLSSFAGVHDVTPEQESFLNDFTRNAVFDDYDLLIQLCDTFMDGTGYCLIEKRIVDVALRYGTTSETTQKWQKILELKRHFENSIGTTIYSLLPGVVENTFA